jgi:hypothetical protein
VVPTSLDQPETAVALGAHHVPQEGITLRTSDISSTIEDVQRTRQVMAPPRTGGFAASPPPPPSPPTGATPAQNPYPNSGPQRIQGPPSTPTPVPAMAQQQAPQQHAYPVQRPHQQSSPPSSNRMWYIATAVVAVLVIATVSILIATSGDSDGGGGGGGTAGDSACEDRSANDQGFSECLLKLAGAVPEHHECEPGAKTPGVGGNTTETPGATVASCTLPDDYLVIYYHFGASEKSDGTELSGTEVAQQNVETIFSSMEQLGKSKDDAEQADWSGGDLSGTSYFLDLSLGNGMLIFTVDDSPLMGVLFKISTGGSGDASVIPAYFDEHIKPGTDGGA